MSHLRPVRSVYRHAGKYIFLGLGLYGISIRLMLRGWRVWMRFKAAPERDASRVASLDAAAERDASRVT